MESPKGNRIGYAWLADRFGVVTLPYWRETRVLEKGVRRLVERDGREIEFLPAVRDPGDAVFAQLEFALKREGFHPELLRKVIPKLEAEEVAAFVKGKPTGRYARVIWWLYEEFSRTRLDVPDLEMGGYVDLLDEDLYVTGRVEKVRRQRINVNLLGTADFSPMVRKKGLGVWSEKDLRKRCEEIAGEYPSEIFERAVRYLYAKESKSSHEIERETPDQKRAKKFIGLLEQAWHRSFLKKEALVELQKAIVDERYANDGWRSEIDEQVYVGETIGPGSERIHFAAPKPEDLDELMASFLLMARSITSRRIRIGEAVNLEHSCVPTLVAAAVVSFVFDFLHPFSDGNGRIHRFLLHHVLARNGFGPAGIILPVSAVILNRPREYDQALESFSKPLMELMEYSLDDRQRMTVTNDTVDFYRYIDCTELTRITIDFIRETIETELPSELRYLASYDEIRRGMREVVEMPDRHADLFVMLVRQNGGTLSKKKRQLSEFHLLTDEEVVAMEKVVREGLAVDGKPLGEK
ncbi:Fic family protein [Haloferula sp.]|uniref:Fic family protein n=1 Tax=Haloferula sp. TaxID=2497595 RepID=UPI003C71CCEB